MPNDLPAIFNGIEKAMRHLSDRQRIIAQNIANSETPGYKANELEAQNFGDLVRIAGGERNGLSGVARPTVQLTSGMSSLGARSLESTSGLIKDRSVSETKPDGNNVTVEDQLLKMGQVQQDFAALTSLYRKQMNLLKVALGRGGSGN
jgi:flagellar basal-body rod protein FlgB